jgi:hypothetical protein
MTWNRINLNAPEFQVPSEPPYLCGIVYKGKRHALTGPPEALKTLAALILGLEHVRGGHGSFALVDFEMGERATRLLLSDLGATDEEIEGVYYVTPDGPPDANDLEQLRAAGVTLVIIDAAAGAYDASGLDDNKRQDAERFGRLWVDPLWRAEITTALLDHVVKNLEARGKYAIGSERKLGTVDVSLGLEVVTQLRRGGKGIVRIATNKDRPGFLHRPRAGELHLASDPETHQITWTFKLTEDDAETAANFRPTHLMDKTLEYVARNLEPVTRNDVLDNVNGKRQFILQGIKILVEEKRLTEVPGPNRTKFLSIPNRQDAQVPPQVPGAGNLSNGKPANKPNLRFPSSGSLKKKEPGNLSSQVPGKTEPSGSREPEGTSGNLELEWWRELDNDAPIAQP